jgi:sirohydrochlorin cobaltochelatase
MNRFVITATTLLLSANALLAQTKVGTIVVAHGGGVEWNQRVHDLVADVKTGGPVAVSFLMGPGAKSNPFHDAVRSVEQAGASHIVVVPLLVSSHSGHYEQIRYLAGETTQLSEQMKHHLEMSGLHPAVARIPITVAPAIDDAPEAARVLADRARSLVRDATGRALFIVGHGPNSSEELAIWMRNLRVLADSVRRLAGFADVRVGVVQDDAPAAVRAEAVLRVRELITLQASSTRAQVAVVPVLISKGTVSDQKVPNDLTGLPIVYSGEPLLPHASMARWVERRVAEAERTALR